MAFLGSTGNPNNPFTAGHVPPSDGDPTKFLCANGTFATLAGAAVLLQDSSPGTIFQTGNMNINGVVKATSAFFRSAVVSPIVYVQSNLVGGIVIQALNHLGTTIFQINEDGTVFATLPTSDPHAVGQLWANVGVVTVSAG
jgi:hypothetical protein